VLDAVYMGLAIDPANETVYVAGGRDWSVMAFNLATRERLFRIDCAHESGGQSWPNGYVGDLRLSADGKTIYALDQSNFRFLIISVPEKKVVRSVAVGRYPFGLTLHPSGKRAYVANVGMFEYAWLTDEQGNRAMLDFPPFGVPSREAEQGVTINGVYAPGLGDPNDIRGMSVWTLDISKPGEECVVARAKTGHLVGEQLEDFPAVGGSSPNSVVATERFVFVSNGSNDSISVLDAESGNRLHDIDLALDPRVSKLRGLIPFGLALAPDGKRLYVAEAGINAVAVVDIAAEPPRLLGHIPTAWFPSRVAVSPDGKTLYVANAKGIGSGPNAGPGHRPGDPTGVGDLMRGYLEIVPLPETDEELAALTKKVVDNNVRFVPRDEDPRPEGHPVPPAPKTWKSPIKHVIYVTKENRTYDEVFGALPGGRGDAELCRNGRPIEVTNEDGSRKVQNVLVMPNHIALAKRFSINDNFYCDSDHSTDGHRWLVGTYPNEFMEAKIGESAEGEGPGNFAFIGSSGAIYPEDYNEAGSIWEHFDAQRHRLLQFRARLRVRLPRAGAAGQASRGIRLDVNYPMPQVALRRIPAAPSPRTTPTSPTSSAWTCSKKT
jgi:DNA-binding beta-propeller fold protein YncE